jgi:hypothetical protein
MAYGSPNKNLNKGYAGQEKKDLMNDNPIARDASGGRGSWMSKHVSKSSPLHAGTGEKIGKAVDTGLSAISDAAKKYNIVAVTKRALNSDAGKKVKTAVKNVLSKNVTRAN